MCFIIAACLAGCYFAPENGSARFGCHMRVYYVYVYIYYMYLMLWPTVIIMNVRLWFAKKFTVNDDATQRRRLAQFQIGPAVMGAVPGKVSPVVDNTPMCVRVCVCHSSRTHTRCDAPLKIQVTAAGDKVRPVRSASDANVQGLGAACCLLLLLGWCQ